MSTSSPSSSSTSSSISIYGEYPSNRGAIQAASRGGEEQHTAVGSTVTPGPSSLAVQRSYRGGEDDDHQTWAEFLEEDRSERRDSGRETLIGAADDNSSAAGRKRRLTGSDHGTAGLERGQSRTRQSHGSPSPSSGLVREVSWRNDTAGSPGSSRERAIDVSTPPQSVSRQINSLRHRESSFTDYRLPRWQPDSEASNCPICGTTFSFWYRKHHCRKCGRVVCASCSPHRITIPRQFIVQSPETQRSFSTIIQPSPSAVQVINLIDDEDDHSSAGFTSPRRPRARVPSNPALGGGEEVRLCNPCVPDPNPEPPRRYSAYGESGSPWGAQGHQGADSRYGSYRHSSHRSSASMPSHAYQAESPGFQLGARTGAPREGFPPSDSFDYTNSPNFHGFPPGYRPSGSPWRHHQFSPQADASPGGSRQRRAYTQGHAHRTNTSASRSRRLTQSPMGQPRQGVNEHDLCPVCNLILPPRAANGNEEAREAHIRSCIERTGGQTQTGSENQPPSGAPVGMLHFVATEKDCIGDDGTPQECTICMEEYEVGAELTRLECLCKFHKACIVDWFQRRQECPVHKVA